MAGTLVDTNILQTAVAMGLSTLRQNIQLAKIVNRDYEQEIRGAKVGEVVKVAVPAAITSRNVTSDVVYPAVTAVTPTSVSVTVDQWKEAAFAMEDKAVAQIQRGIVPMQLAEAAKALANAIDDYLWGLVHGANGVFGYVGTAATTPFGTSLSELFSARKVAADQLMPTGNRYCLIDPAAEENALNLRSIQDASWRGNSAGLVAGEIGNVGGCTVAMSQNVPQHTAGTASGATTDTTGYAAGLKTVTLDSAGTGTILVGDIITFAGQTTTYVVTAGDADVSNGGTVSFEPGLSASLASSAIAITVKATHRVNMLIHRDCIAFAMAPLMDTVMTASRRANTAIVIDEMSGLALRLEIADQYKQTQWSFDALYGGNVIRRELGVRIAG